MIILKIKGGGAVIKGNSASFHKKGEKTEEKEPQRTWAFLGSGAIKVGKRSVYEERRWGKKAQGNYCDDRGITQEEPRLTCKKSQDKVLKKRGEGRCLDTSFKRVET